MVSERKSDVKNGTRLIPVLARLVVVEVVGCYAEFCCNGASTYVMSRHRPDLYVESLSIWEGSVLERTLWWIIVLVP